jgi:hypothetical protein
MTQKPIDLDAERLVRRWRPVVPSPDGDTGEDPDRMPLTVEDFERVSRDGGLEPGQRFERLSTDFSHRPAYSAAERAAELWFTDAELDELLEREQAEADRRHGEGRSRSQGPRRRP